MAELTKYEKDSLQKLGESIHSGRWSNAGLVQLIELAGCFLNLKTIPGYCRSTGISYNGAKNNRQVVKLFDVKFIVDN